MAISLYQSDSIPDKNLQKLIDRVGSLLKLSIVQGLNAAARPNQNQQIPTLATGAGDPAKATCKSIATLVYEQFRSCPDMDFNTMLVRLNEDQHTSKTVHEQVDLKKIFAFVNAENFTDSTMKHMLRDLQCTHRELDLHGHSGLKRDYGVIDKAHGFVPPGWPKASRQALEIGPTPPVSLLNKTLQFRVHQVLCLSNCAENDLLVHNIAWVGAALEDNTSSVGLEDTLLKRAFLAGDKASYSPPRVFKTFTLDKSYPKNFVVILALTGKNNANHGVFIQVLYEAIKTELIVLLAALGATAGPSITTALHNAKGSVVPGVLGDIVGVAAGALLGSVLQWLAKIVNEDVFSPMTSMLSLKALDSDFDGGVLTSHPQDFNFRGRGQAHYRVTYDWQLTR